MTKSTQEKNLQLSIVEGFLYSLMVGAGETYLPAYVLSVGMGEIFAGLLTTLPLVSGAFLQLFAPKVLQKLESHKSWVVASTFLQAITFLPLVYFSIFYSPDFWSLFLVLTLYWASGFAAGPAWNYWMGRLVHVDEGSSYFAKRSRVAQMGVLLGLLCGGLALHYKVDLGPFSSVFTLLFLFSFCCRIFSTWLLYRQHFAKDWLVKTNFSLQQAFELFFKNVQHRRFFFRLVPFQAAVFITGPFVTAFMLVQLKLSYLQFMIATAALFIGKMLTMKWIEFHEKSGLKLFMWGALSIAPLPLGWLVSGHFYWVVLLQLLSGLAWAFVEVGLSLIFFKDLKSEDKVPVLTVYNFMNAVAMVIGTGLGAKILWLGNSQYMTYVFLFILGSILRFLFFILIYQGSPKTN